MAAHHDIRSLVEHILANATAFTWTLQGFGMLRLHLPDNRRLHVWHRDFAVPGVSTIHDHLQWGLSSFVVSGRLMNRIWVEERDPNRSMMTTFPMKTVTIKPGVGTHFKDDARSCYLRIESDTWYEAGQTYGQEPNVIHESFPTDGTVTLMTKAPTGDDSARVFWHASGEWVSAEPRVASRTEIIAMTAPALHRLREEKGA